MGTYGLTGSAALTAAATTYLFGVVQTATADGVVTSFDVTFDAGTFGQGIKLELFRATGGIPSATTFTPLRINGGAQARASQQASAWIAPITATPTGLTVARTWYVPNTSGQAIQLPLGREIFMIPGATNWIGARVVTPAAINPNVAFNFEWDE